MIYGGESGSNLTVTVDLGLSSILHVSYEDEDLVVQTLLARNGGTYAYHVIPPLDRDDPRPHSGTPNLDANFVCHYFRVPATENQEDVISLVQHEPDTRNLWVSASVDRQRMQLELRDPFWSFVRSNVLQVSCDSS